MGALIQIFAACNLKSEAHVLRGSSYSPTARIAFAQETPPHSSITSRQIKTPPTTPLKLTVTTSLTNSISSQFSILMADSNWSSPPPPAISFSFSLQFSASILNKPTEDPPSDKNTINNPSPSCGRVKWSKAGPWGLLLGKPSNISPIYDIRPSSSYEQPRDKSDNAISGGSDTDDDENYTPNSPTPRKEHLSLQNNESQSIKLIKTTKQDQDNFLYKPRSNSSVKPRSSSSIKSKLSPLKSDFKQTKQLSNHRKQSFEDRHKQQQKIGIMPSSFFYNTYGRNGGLGRSKGYDEEHDNWELVAGDDGGEKTDGDETTGGGETTQCGEEEEEGGGDGSCSIDSSLLDDRNRAKTISPTSPQPIRSSFVHRLSNTFMDLKAVRLASSQPQLQRPVSEPLAVTATKKVKSSPPAAEQSQSETEREESEGEESVKKPILGRFERVIEKMNRAMLSVSPDVVFPPPHLLVSLRQQEIAEMTEGLGTITKLPIRSTLPPRPKLNPLDRQ
ncbi:hypothetical protein CROQUDRAFT_86598 [Cronartium quercuum f. sp. fusiforme G11]|uniref:Uncharacterized protein n=1 Tax=Cronartium quercuum f. sp. fusiforme G11 TaxID=708437 RepID=A0A9P6THA4_9BASI|nr:hypothetical protein CROQUDRAFT_86598 [Cronartium quercuum f. sp. fusiforme G11]